jgi:hypothetical protein
MRHRGAPPPAIEECRADWHPFGSPRVPIR